MRGIKRVMSIVIITGILFASGCAGKQNSFSSSANKSKISGSTTSGQNANDSSVDYSGASSKAIDSSNSNNLSSSKQSASSSGGGNINNKSGFRGVFFNPNIRHPQIDGYPFVQFLFYEPDSEYRSKIQTVLAELKDIHINFVSVFVCVLHTFKDYKKPNEAGQPIDEWGNFDYLDNFALFIEDCSEEGISVEVSLVDNRWIPYSVDSGNHIGKPGGYWPVADSDPWNEAATWYSEVIKYVEAKTKCPESIAMWSMMGNYQWGASEPVLWYDEGTDIYEYTEQFVLNVWPVFKSAGKRPKASPYALPIFSSNGYWIAKSPDERLAAFINLKKWLSDELNLLPDYWMMSTYPKCDPATDGFNYLQRIVEILGKKNANRIISTDLKTIGHEQELNGSIIDTDVQSGRDLFEWHMQKCAEYGFGGWWIWSYQDSGSHATGIRYSDGRWKTDILQVIKNYMK